MRIKVPLTFKYSEFPNDILNVLAIFIHFYTKNYILKLPSD